jgi:hypothetical protein
MNGLFGIFVFATLLTFCNAIAAPELIDPKKSEVPFAGEPFWGDSMGKEGYSLSVTTTAAATLILCSRNDSAVARLILPTSMSVHSPMWVGGKCWFVLRKAKQFTTGTVVALVLFDPELKERKFVFHSTRIGQKKNGWIFYLDAARDGGVVARCGIRDPENPKGRIDYVSGFLPKEKLTRLPEEEMAQFELPELSPH